VNRFRWPTDKSIDSANHALSSWLGLPDSNWQMPRTHWSAMNPQARKFANRVRYWLDAGFAKDRASKTTG
jgi:hypothetical protein